MTKLNKNTILNIFQNYIPNEKSKCDYLKSPCVNGIIESFLEEKPKLTKKYIPKAV